MKLMAATTQTNYAYYLKLMRVPFDLQQKKSK